MPVYKVRCQALIPRQVRHGKGVYAAQRIQFRAPRLVHPLKPGVKLCPAAHIERRHLRAAQCAGRGHALVQRVRPIGKRMEDFSAQKVDFVLLCAVLVRFSVVLGNEANWCVA